MTEDQSKVDVKRFLPILLVVMGIGVFFGTGANSYLSFAALSHHRADLLAFASEHGVASVAVFIVTYILVVGLSLPGGVWLTLAGGFVFGGVVAGIYVVFGATIGATLIFLAARTAFGDVLRGRAGAGLAKMEDGFRQNAFQYLLVLRLVPLFPFWLVNLVPAFLNVKLSTYVLATIIGILPGTFVYAHVGAGLGAVFESGDEPDLGIIFQPQILLPILALAGLSLLPILYQKWKQRA